MKNVIVLHTDLRDKTYTHSAYEAFNISDPKPRHIHKASVRDRLVHHALYCALYPSFDKTYMGDSYSCRVYKGTHRALERFEAFSRIVSQNNTQTAWVLKCDVRKFFASIDQEVLMDILRQSIVDIDVLWLLGVVIQSFYSTRPGLGLPLGNLTSQLLVNIYMNEFDQYMKHRTKAEHYIRYADDFVVLSRDKQWLESVLIDIQDFLSVRLKLQLHPNKVSIDTLASGIDFLGWVHFPHHRVLRTVTKRRMFRNIDKTDHKTETIESYLGLLSHGNAHALAERVTMI